MANVTVLRTRDVIFLIWVASLLTATAVAGTIRLFFEYSQDNFVEEKEIVGDNDVKTDVAELLTPIYENLLEISTSTPKPRHARRRRTSTTTTSTTKPLKRRRRRTTTTPSTTTPFASEPKFASDTDNEIDLDYK